eukprot:PhF_6_TR7951/c1_g1_i1/m.11997
MTSFLRLSTTLLVIISLTISATNAVPVTVNVIDYVSGKPLVGHIVTFLEQNQQYTAGSDGRFHLDIPNGTMATFMAKGDKTYRETQSATVVVPPTGLTTITTEVVLQVPSNLIFDAFFLVTPGTKNMSCCCQIVVTVCAFNKTSYDSAQGLPNTTVAITPNIHGTIFYFGTWGPISNATNPFPNNLNGTSWDGGVLIENVPPGRYVVTAQHPGYTFSDTVIVCGTPGVFINGAPNQGPRANHP